MTHLVNVGKVVKIDKLQHLSLK